MGLQSLLGSIDHSDPLESEAEVTQNYNDSEFARNINNIVDHVINRGITRSEGNRRISHELYIHDKDRYDACEVAAGLTCNDRRNRFDYGYPNGSSY